MADETDQGIAYLKALKQSVGPTTAAGPAPALEAGSDFDSSAADSSERFQGAEKRRSRRYRCEGSAELREEGADVRTWATFSDVSLHGCYVEAQATYPVGTILDMKLDAYGVRVESQGTVRVNYPYLGMGIAFLEMSEASQAQLKELLSKISRPTLVLGAKMPSPVAVPESPDAIPLVANPTSAVRALADFFETHQLLMRDDFFRILRKSQLPETKR